jgi:hypothetical protein
MSVAGVRLCTLDSTHSFTPVNISEFEKSMLKFVPEGYIDGETLDIFGGKTRWNLPIIGQNQERHDQEAAARRRPIRIAKLHRTITQNRVAFHNPTKEKRGIFGSSQKEGMRGIVPNTAKIGDIIVILKAVETPFLLRPQCQDSRYEVIGEAFVDTCMDGTASNGKRETFVLC